MAICSIFIVERLADEVMVKFYLFLVSTCGFATLIYRCEILEIQLLRNQKLIRRNQVKKKGDKL